MSMRPVIPNSLTNSLPVILTAIGNFRFISLNPRLRGVGMEFRPAELSLVDIANIVHVVCLIGQKKVSNYNIERDCLLKNRKICCQIQNSIANYEDTFGKTENSLHWITQLFKQLSIKFEHFYINAQSPLEATYQYKNQLLSYINSIERKRKKEANLVAKTLPPHFWGLVHIVFHEFCLHGFLPGTSILTAKDPRIEHQRKILKEWELMISRKKGFRQELYRDLNVALMQKELVFDDYAIRRLNEEFSRFVSELSSVQADLSAIQAAFFHFRDLFNLVPEIKLLTPQINDQFKALIKMFEDISNAVLVLKNQEDKNDSHFLSKIKEMIEMSINQLKCYTPEGASIRREHVEVRRELNRKFAHFQVLLEEAPELEQELQALAKLLRRFNTQLGVVYELGFELEDLNQMFAQFNVQIESDPAIKNNPKALLEMITHAKAQLDRFTPEGILARFKHRADLIGTLWSFMSHLDRLREHDLLVTFFNNNSFFLHFFMKAVDGKATAAELKNFATIDDLNEMRIFLETNPDFNKAFVSGRFYEHVKGLSIDLFNMKEQFFSLVLPPDSQPIDWTSGRITDPANFRQELKRFLIEKKVPEEELDEFTKEEKYFQRYRIYPIGVLKEALENFVLQKQAKCYGNWSTAAVLLWKDGLVVPGDSTARSILSELCFECFISHLVKKSGIKNPQEFAVKLYVILKEVVEILNNHKTPLVMSHAILHGVADLINCSTRLIQQDVSQKGILEIISTSYIADPATFWNRFGNLKSSLSDLHPVIRRMKQRVLEGKPLITNKRPNIDKIWKILHDEPFLLISYVLPDFVHALMPEMDPEIMQGFRKALQMMESPFNNSPAKAQLQEIVNLLFKDPFIAAGLESANTLAFAKEYFRNLQGQLQRLFAPIAEGAKLGNSLTEKEMSDLIEEIVLIRTIKNDTTQLNERQKLLLKNIPEVAKTASSINGIVQPFLSVLNFRIGSVGVGNLIATRLGGVVSWFAGTVAKVAPALAEKPSSSNSSAITLKKEEDLKSIIVGFMNDIKPEDRSQIEAALDQHVIPVFLELTTKIGNNHTLTSYADFFKQLQVMIESNDTSAEKMQQDRDTLTRLLASLILQVPGEIEMYGEALSAIYNALMYAEHCKNPSPWNQDFILMLPSLPPSIPAPSVATAPIVTRTTTNTLAITTTTAISPSRALIKHS